MVTLKNTVPLEIPLVVTVTVWPTGATEFASALKLSEPGDAVKDGPAEPPPPPPPQAERTAVVPMIKSLHRPTRRAVANMLFSLL